MSSCKHSNLALIPPQDSSRLRCRHCHLTLKAEELGDGFCPECFEERGKKHYDFDQIETETSSATRYRCEDCGVIIESN